MHAAAALSEHPLATHALGECVGQLMETGGTHPDVLVVTCTPAYQGALDDIVAAARRLLSPTVLFGSSAAGVLAGGREVEDHAGLAMFALWGDRAAGADPVPLARPVRLEGRDLTTPGGLAGAAGTLVLLADPFTCDPDELLSALDEDAPDVAVVGGVVGAARHRGGNRLLLDGEQFMDGAVGVLLDPTVPVTALVSHGTRSVGQPMTVTAAERRMVRELAGRPAFERLRAAVEACSPDDQLLAADGVLLGRVHDDHVGPEPEMTVTRVLGVDHDAGALAIADEVPVGATVRFQIRGRVPAHDDLIARLAAAVAGADRPIVPAPASVACGSPSAAARRPGPVGALVFTSAARGAAFFGEPDHDAATVAEHLASGAVAGAFCSGELGPVGRDNAAHSSSAVVVLLG